MSKRLWSALTDNMDCCIYTGSHKVERHHIFGGANRRRSEKYGFVVPLRPDYHPNGVHFDPKNGDIDTDLKQAAQRYWEEYIGTREDFRKEFGRSWL